MLSESKRKIIDELIASSDREELIWLNGYLQGVLANRNPAETIPTIAPRPKVNKVTITYGTETGNSKKLASEFAAKAKKLGINTKLVSLDQYRITDLPKEECFLTIVSTQGEGDPPAAAKKFYDHIHNNGFKLEGLKYSVLALGDTSYPLFCKAGEDVDNQLQKLGGQRIASLQKCDTDYSEPAESWFSQVLNELTTAAQKPSVSTTIAPAKTSSGKKTYTGTVLSNINLNDRGSNKETHHIEIAAEGVDYLPGDSLGIVPKNPERIVQGIISLLKLEPGRNYSFRGIEHPVYELLKSKLNIVCLPERVVSKYASLVQQSIPETKIGLLDLLKIYPLNEGTDAAQLIELLEPVTPRLYSISSSPEAHGGEVHITVARDRFKINDETKYGLCSDYLSQFAVNEELEFYIHRNSQFRLPEDERDVIMIGPGTGVAPFRSFIAHRDARGAQGRNWLFFGEQHFVTDFLYQSEIQNWKETGVLTNVDVAFSRDQESKVYVQHKIQKQGRQVYEWIENGASIYLCGNKDPMSVDVENTLIETIQLHGSRSADEAIEYVEKLKEAGRFLKDVY
ncbi:MAG: sulfite reductase flavoprotein subunit alpha [Flavisolibacter sp.]